MVIKQRAISDEQKQERRQVILKTALELFERLPYNQISILHVAKQAGLAKGTIYLYFKTKEELFLALLTQQIEDWFDEVDNQLSLRNDRQTECAIPELVTLLNRSLQNHLAAIRLVTISHTILEQNIDFPSALAFKQNLLTHSVQTGKLLETCLPFLEPGEGARLILRIYLLIIGVQSLAEPAEIVRQTLDLAGMEAFRVDFQQELAQILTGLLNGMQYLSARRDL